MTITELLESWKGRAEKAEAELARVQRELDHKKMWANEIAACAKEELEKAHKEIERVQLERDHYKNKVERYREVLGANTNESICEAAERVQAASARMRESLEKIAAFTNPDDENSYRADDREGCLDTVYSTAKSALANDAGTGYVRKEDVVRDVKPLLDALEKIMFASPCSELDVPYTARVAELALAHAKSKGLTE